MATSDETGHPQLDFEKWASVFPIEKFEKQEGPRQFASTEPGDPLDLWKARGEIITSPSQLCAVELGRRRAAETYDLGEPVPVDIFLWATAPPARPYLTKLGGVPHREAGKPWPTSEQGRPYTFIGQFCFVDSRDIVDDPLPGDVLLVFFEDEKSVYGGEIQLEWSSIDLENPTTANSSPPPGFTVPQLSGVIYSCDEFPESGEVFEQQGHYQSWLFATTQATKIGRETYFIQHDPRWEDDDLELLCTLNSLHPAAQWPFIDCETMPGDANESRKHYGWGKYRMMFGDVGCIYFLLDGDGQLLLHFDCY